MEERDQKVSVGLGGVPPWAFRHRSLLKTRLGCSPMPQLPVLPCRTFQAPRNQNSCRWQYKKAPLEPQRYPLPGGVFSVLWIVSLPRIKRIERIACGYWVQDKNNKNPLRWMQDVSYEPLMLCPSENPQASLDIFSQPHHHPFGFLHLSQGDKQE